MKGLFVVVVFVELVENSRKRRITGDYAEFSINPQTKWNLHNLKWS
jgi:hypothetical protein